MFLKLQSFKKKNIKSYLVLKEYPFAISSLESTNIGAAEKKTRAQTRQYPTV